MFTHLLRRLLLGVFTLFVITAGVYGLIRAMPGDPLLVNMEHLDPNRSISEKEQKRLRAAFGLDRPIYVAYFEWLGKVAVGDFGTSFSRKLPVSRMVSERVWPTLLLSVSSLVLAYVISIPLGLYATARSGRLSERAFSTGLYALYSLPVFVAGLVLLMFFHQRYQLLPLGGMYSDNYEELSIFGKIADVAWHALLPIICSTYATLAYDTRFIKANMQEVIRQDYIRTARAKGVSPVNVLVHHAFRNTLIPLVTMLGLTLPALLSGAVIIEQIFTWPGMGNLYFEAIRERDYPTIMALTLLFSVLTLLGQLLADVLYSVVDPRVTQS